MKCCRPDASKNLQAPSGDSIPHFMNCTVELGYRQRFVPPTIAASHLSVRIACSAWSSAIRLDEHAVSTAKLGPAANIPHSTMYAQARTLSTSYRFIQKLNNQSIKCD